jgi:hypothetical protein
MMFSATSLAEASNSPGSACRGSVPLIGLELTVVPVRRKKSSGDSEATAPQSPDRKAARAGPVRATASAKKSRGEPLTVPLNAVHTHAW